MGNTDSVPIISQTKSLVQALCSDNEGAKRTQINFTKSCPLVSQTRSLIEHLAGDDIAALDTQLVFVEGMNKLANSLPIVGHAKGLVHYALNDKESGNDAMKSSSRTIGVIGGAVAGGLTVGPMGAFAGGVMAGVAMDGIITGADYYINKEEYRPHGYVAAMSSLVKDEVESKSGCVFDIVAGLTCDGLAGLGASSSIRTMSVTNSVSGLLDRVTVLNYISRVSVTGSRGGIAMQHQQTASSTDRNDTDEADIDVELLLMNNVAASNDQAYFEQFNSELSSQVPDAFFCPITTELLIDPVVCADGHTYERSAINEWLELHDTSPLTNELLTDKSLLPNRALRKLVASFREKHGIV